MKKTKYLIIGAGISGLSLALFLNDKNYLILEKDKEAGGYCRTTYRKEYTWDYAGHFFHFSNPEIREFFLDRIDKNGLIYNKKNTKVFYKGEYIDYPFQRNIHQLKKDDFIDCLFELYFKKEKDSYENFGEMLYGKFGKGITERFLKPYNEKLYACDLNTLDVDSMGRFFPYADLADIILNMKKGRDDSYNSEFMYHKKGAVVFINALYNELEKNRVLLGQEVVRIEKDKKIAYTKTEAYQYEYLINTSMFPQLYSWMGGNRGEKQKLTCNKVGVYNLGFDLPARDRTVHWIYYPDKEICFYRVGFYNNILCESKLSLYVELGRRTSDVRPKNELQTVLSDLQKCRIIDRHQLMEYQYLEMEPAYVHISRESARLVHEKIEEYRSDNVYTLGRYGKWSYSSIEDAVYDAKELAKKIGNCLCAS